MPARQEGRIRWASIFFIRPAGKAGGTHALAQKARWESQLAGRHPRSILPSCRLPPRYSGGQIRSCSPLRHGTCGVPPLPSGAGFAEAKEAREIPCSPRRLPKKPFRDFLAGPQRCHPSRGSEEEGRKRPVVKMFSRGKSLGQAFPARFSPSSIPSDSCKAEGR